MGNGFQIVKDSFGNISQTLWDKYENTILEIADPGDAVDRIVFS
jgi:hypothetical protein